MTDFNVILSGVSISGDVDVLSQPITIQKGNADRIGYATFALQNKGSDRTRANISGAPPVEIEFNGVTLFRGTVERVDNLVSVTRGQQTIFHCYGQGQELLGVLSPDARLQSLFKSGTNIVDILSGDQGTASRDGMELTSVVSGIDFQSGAQLSSFLSQFFGTETDPSGSFSGTLFSFKPHISGYTWDTWYKPDGSPDNNDNYHIPFGTLKVRREYAWDVLRRISRQAICIDSAGNRVAFESYIGVSGDIHVFTSGSDEFIPTDANGSGIVFQYYQENTSGANLNNIIEGINPLDTTSVKNYLVGWFPKWTKSPIDQDFFTDIIAFSGDGAGSFWSGNKEATTISGNAPATSGFGFISIMGESSGTPGTAQEVRMIYTHPGSGASIDIEQFNVVGGGGVKMAYKRQEFFTTAGTTRTRNVRIIDTSGNFMIQSGAGAGNDLGDGVFEWLGINDTIFNDDGTFNSGTGRDGGWAFSTSAPVLTRIKQIEFGINFAIGLGPQLRRIFIDNLFFSFNIKLSPVQIFNSGSQSLYKRRYAVLEYPFEVTPEQASGIMNHELNARMGSKQYAEITIKDNPDNPRVAVQLDINPGQVVVVDAPALNTGSGQTFFYWRLIDVTHEYSTQGGFRTKTKLIPWFSGTLVDPNTNLIDYTLPFKYSTTPGNPVKRTMELPINWPILQLN